MAELLAARAALAARGAGALALSASYVQVRPVARPGKAPLPHHVPVQITDKTP